MTIVPEVFPKGVKFFGRCFSEERDVFAHVPTNFHSRNRENASAKGCNTIWKSFVIRHKKTAAQEASCFSQAGAVTCCPMLAPVSSLGVNMPL